MLENNIPETEKLKPKEITPKDFDGWNEFKKKLDKKNEEITFRNREIWWCSVGVNIDCEENGKNEQYERPVLILQKLARNKFYGVPLSTQPQRFDNYYYKFSWKGKVSYALLDQVRVFSTNRLGLRYGDKRLNFNHYYNIKTRFLAIFGFRNLIPLSSDRGPQYRDFRPVSFALIILIILGIVKFLI